MTNIDTERLHLKIISMADSESVFETLNFQNTAETISIFSWPMTFEQADSWCHRSVSGFEKKSDFTFIAFEKKNSKPIGCCGIHKDTDFKAEIGYWVSDHFQKQGYASEMIKALIAYSFNELAFTKLFATVKPSNLGSSRVLVKNSFSFLERKEIKSLDNKLYLKDIYELDK